MYRKQMGIVLHYKIIKKNQRINLKIRKKRRWNIFGDFYEKNYWHVQYLLNFAPGEHLMNLYQCL